MGMNEKLAELRKAKGLTQKELAETLHVTRQAISRWEMGTAAPSLDNLTYLSQLYGVPLDDLVNTGDTVSEPEEDVLSCVSEDLTPPSISVPARVVWPHGSLIPLLLASLVLGVGILIGLSLREPTEEIYLYPSNPGGQITVGYLDGWEGWLEQTPADIEAEKEYLESSGQKEYLGADGQTKDYYSIYYPASGILRTFPNDSSENTPTTP